MSHADIRLVPNFPSHPWPKWKSFFSMCCRTHMRIFSVLYLASKSIEYVRELIVRLSARINQFQYLLSYRRTGSSSTTLFELFLKGVQVREPGHFRQCCPSDIRRRKKGINPSETIIKRRKINNYNNNQSAMEQVST